MLLVFNWLERSHCFYVNKETVALDLMSLFWLESVWKGAFSSLHQEQNDYMTINENNICLLTVARSFWVRPLSCRPFWMTFPTSRLTLSWCSSSVSRSSLAVFLVTRCCLFCPAAPVRHQSINRRSTKKKGGTRTMCQICTESRKLHFLDVSTSSPRLWAAAIAWRRHRQTTSVSDQVIVVHLYHGELQRPAVWLRSHYLSRSRQ